MMRRRKALAEHPFGTLNCRAGYRHFLVRGFEKVRGEWGLMALCYNFTRVLNIIGFDRFIAFFASRAQYAIRLMYAALLAAIGPITARSAKHWTEMTRNAPPKRQAVATAF